MYFFDGTYDQNNLGVGWSVCQIQYGNLNGHVTKTYEHILILTLG